LIVEKEKREDLVKIAKSVEILIIRKLGNACSQKGWGASA